MNYTEIIESVITDRIVEEYTLAEFGDKLGVYQDGTVGIGQSVGDEIEEDERPIAMIACPGWSNVDQSVYTQPMGYNSDSDTYTDDEGISHTLEECVESAIENDGSFREEIVAKLIGLIV